MRQASRCVFNALRVGNPSRSMAVGDRDPVDSGKAMHYPTKATSHAHQVCVIEVFLGAVVQTPPPLAKAARRVTQ